MMVTRVLLLTLFLFLPITVFAETSGQIGEFVEDGVGSIYDGVTNEIVIPDENPLGTTQEEFDNLKSDGWDVISAVINLFRTSHSLAESTVEASVPYDLSEFWLGILGIIVVAVLVIPTLKKIGMDIMKIAIICIIIVVGFYSIGIIY